MNPIKKIMVLSGLNLIAVFLLFSTAQAEKWWESKQESTATDQIEISSSDSSRTASRTNWEDGYIEVMAGATADTRDTVNLAHAYSVALKTARHLAYEKLAETVNGINLYGDATYDRELLKDSNLKTVVRSMIRGARVLEERKSTFSDGAWADGSIWAEVVLGLKLRGEDGLIKPTTEWQSKNKPVVKPSPAPQAVRPTPLSQRNSGLIPYTGLVIDATGLGGSPAMLPKVISENGDVVYGTLQIDRAYVIKTGLMGYQNNLEKATDLSRVGNNPLVIKAVRVNGKNKADFVISNEDAERVKEAVALQNFLRECRVVAVLD